MAASWRRALRSRSSRARKWSKPISDTATSCRRKVRVLSLEGVYAGYDDALTLHGVSLEVKRGEMVAMIGANGAGKSTTLRTICGFLRPKRGSIEFDGHSIAGLTPDRIAALGLVHVPEGRRVFPDLSVEENLLAAAYLLRDRREVQRRLAEGVERLRGLRERRKQPAGTLSGGEQQMLAFGRAMMTGPKLLLLDEPSLGLAPRLVGEVMRSVKMFRDAGVTVLLVEQNANLALRLADRGYVMETGAILMQCSRAELLANEHVRESYLGARRHAPQHLPRRSDSMVFARRKFLQASAAASALGMFGPRAAAQGSGPIKIGAFGPMSGNAAAQGQSLRAGMEMVVKARNASGGIGGRPIDLIVGGDAGDTGEAGGVRE